jgi:hypothetical protein
LPCGCFFQGREFHRAEKCGEHEEASDVLKYIGFADHTNAGDEYCCPHCLESAKHEGVDWLATAVECPKCGMTFAAWKDEVIVHRSAKLAP